MKITTIIETSIYSSNLKEMKDFYIDILRFGSCFRRKKQTCIFKSRKKHAFNFQS